MASQVQHSVQVQQTRTGFQCLPVEIRLEIYRLILPTKTVVDIMEKPTFYGRSYRHTSFWLPLIKDSDDDFHSEESEEDRDDDPDSAEDITGAQPGQQGGAVNGGQDGSNSDNKGNDNGDSKTSLQKQKVGLVDDWAREPIFKSVRDANQQRQAITGLLLTCRSVREEVLDVLYGGNLLYIDLFRKSWPWKQHTGVAKMKKLRHLMLILSPPSFFEEWQCDTIVLDAVLPNLRSLRIVARQPFLYRQYEMEKHHKKCNCLRARTTWTAAFQQVLGLVKAKLPRSATLIADVGGEHRSSIFSLLDGLSHPYQRLRTKMGDRVFRRHDGDRWKGDDIHEGPGSPRCAGCELATDGKKANLRISR